MTEEKMAKKFVGDCGANGGILLNLPMSLSTETALETAETILAFVDEHRIDTIYPGHAPIGMSKIHLRTGHFWRSSIRQATSIRDKMN